MGMFSDWHCQTPGCNVVVRQVSGGPDRGFVALTETRVCTDCRAVRDYTIGLASEGGDETNTDKRGQAPVEPSPRCARCGGTTVPWDRSCPRCGGPMKSDRDSRILWD